MPKMKTHRGAAKRFKVAGSGKVKRKQSHRRHILTKKTPKRKRQLRSPVYLMACDAPVIKKFLVKLKQKFKRNKAKPAAADA